MSELLNTLTGVLQQFGKIEIAGLLIAVALLLVWLLVRIMLRRSEQMDEASARPRQPPAPDYSAEPSAMQEAELSKQAGRISQTVAAVENKPVSAPVAEPVTTAVQPRMATASTSRIPEDSVLRRHYLAQLQAQKQALANPYPTDSVLRRHYDQLHKLAVESAPAVQSIEASAPRAAKTSIIEQAIAKDSSAVVAPIASAAPVARCRLPQDSVLKRHFIAQLQAEIEAKLSPKPSDSVLRRHYENLVRRELENRLAGFNV